MTEIPEGLGEQDISDGSRRPVTAYPEGMTMTQWALHIAGAFRMPIEQAQGIVSIEETMAAETPEQFQTF